MRGAVVLFLLAAIVCAQDAKNFKRAFEMILKGGAVPKANELLHDQFVTWLAENPEPARAVCEAAANAVRKTSKRYPSDWEDIVAKLVRATDQMGDADTDELAARAEALLCRARFNDDPNRSPGPEAPTRSAGRRTPDSPRPHRDHGVVFSARMSRPPVPPFQGETMG